MKVAVVIASFLTAASLAAQGCRTPSPTAAWLLVQKQTLSEEDGAWQNDSLRAALIHAAGMKSGAVPEQLGWEEQGAGAPSANESVSYLRTLATTPGSPWPTRRAVGLAGLRAVFLLTRSDSMLARVALERMQESRPGESIKPDVAVLEDRVRVFAGRSQLYGTQLTRVGGRLVPLAIEDSAQVNARRARVNLPPLAWSVCNANAR